MAEVRVLVVEDEPLYRQMLEVILAEDPELSVTAAYSRAEDVLVNLDKLSFDVAMLDIQLAGRLQGHELGFALRRVWPDLGIVLLSNYMEPSFIHALRRHALSGWSYLIKHADIDIETLRRAVKGAARGEIVIDPRIVAAVEKRPRSSLACLTERELQVLQLMAEGWSNGAIAAALNLGLKSVENLINRIFNKLDIQRSGGGLQPRVVAVLRYLEEVRMR